MKIDMNHPSDLFAYNLEHKLRSLSSQSFAQMIEIRVNDESEKCWAGISACTLPLMIMIFRWRHTILHKQRILWIFLLGEVYNSTRPECRSMRNDSILHSSLISLSPPSLLHSKTFSHFMSPFSWFTLTSFKEWLRSLLVAMPNTFRFLVWLPCAPPMMKWRKI